MPLRPYRVPRNETEQQRMERLDREAIQNGRIRTRLRATSHGYNLREYRKDEDDRLKAEQAKTAKEQK